jgi:hypothetical protein
MPVIPGVAGSVPVPAILVLGRKKPGRLSGSFFVIGAANAMGFFRNYHRSPIFAFFDVLFAIPCRTACVWFLLSGVDL